MAAPQASSRLEMLQARFQQKQLQEKEQKLLQLYDQQQQRAYQVVQRGSAGSNSSNPGSHHGSTVSQQTVTRTSSTTHTTSTSQGGKVRQMFDERRQTTVKGIDRSYPLEPLDNKQRKQANGNGVVGAPRPNVTVNRQSVTVKRVARADVNSNVNGGKPVVSYHEEITRESFGPQARHEDDDEFGSESHVARYANGNHPDDGRGEVEIEEIFDEDAMERNRMMAKIHLMQYDDTLKHRVRTDLESEQFPEELMVDVPDRLPKRNATKKLSQAEARLERFKNANQKRNVNARNANPTTTITKKRSELTLPTKTASRTRDTSMTRTRQGRDSSPRSPERKVFREAEISQESKKGSSEERRSSGKSFLDDTSREIRSSSPRFFCKESERSATTFSIDSSADKYDKYDKSKTDSSSKSIFSRKEKTEGSKYFREDDKSEEYELLTNWRTKTSSPVSLERLRSEGPKFHPETEKRFICVETEQRRRSPTPERIFEKRSSSPRFFCRESEKSATTMSVDQKSWSSAAESDLRLKKRVSSPEMFSGGEQKAITTVRIGDRSRSRSPEEIREKRSASPQFFCRESERSATTISIDRKSSGSPTRELLDSKKRSSSPRFSLDDPEKRLTLTPSPEPRKGILKKRTTPQYFYPKPEENKSVDKKVAKSQSAKRTVIKSGFESPTISSTAHRSAKKESSPERSSKGPSASPEFFCRESERSATTFAIDKKAKRILSPEEIKNMIREQNASSGTQTLFSRRSAELKKLDRRSQSPEFPRKSPTFSGGKDIPEKRQVLKTSEKVREGRSSTPEFFCVETERSGTTMSLKPRIPASDKGLKSHDYDAAGKSKSRQSKTFSSIERELRESSKSPEYLPRDVEILKPVRKPGSLKSAGLIRDILKVQSTKQYSDSPKAIAIRDLKFERKSSRSPEEKTADVGRTSRTSSPISRQGSPESLNKYAVDRLKIHEKRDTSGKVKSTVINVADSKRRTNSPTPIDSRRHTSSPETSPKSLLSTEIDAEVYEITMTDQYVERDKIQKGKDGRTTLKSNIERTYTKASPKLKSLEKPETEHPTYPVRKPYKQRAGLLDSNIFEQREGQRSRRGSRSSISPERRDNKSPMPEKRRVRREITKEDILKSAELVRRAMKKTVLERTERTEKSSRRNSPEFFRGESPSIRQIGKTDSLTKHGGDGSPERITDEKDFFGTDTVDNKRENMKFERERSPEKDKSPEKQTIKKICKKRLGQLEERLAPKILKIQKSPVNLRAEIVRRTASGKQNSAGDDAGVQEIRSESSLRSSIVSSETKSASGGTDYNLLKKTTHERTSDAKTVFSDLQDFEGRNIEEGISEKSTENVQTDTFSTSSNKDRSPSKVFKKQSTIYPTSDGEESSRISGLSQNLNRRTSSPKFFRKSVSEKQFEFSESVKSTDRNDITRSINIPVTSCKLSDVIRTRTSGNIGKTSLNDFPRKLPEEDSKIFSTFSNVRRQSKTEEKSTNYGRTDSVESALRRFDSIDAHSERREIAIPEKLEDSTSRSKKDATARCKSAEGATETPLKSRDSLTSRAAKSVLSTSPASVRTRQGEGSAGKSNPKVPQAGRKSRRIASARDSAEITRELIKSRSPGCRRRLFGGADPVAEIERRRSKSSTPDLNFQRSPTPRDSGRTTPKNEPLKMSSYKSISADFGVKDSSASSSASVKPLRSIEDIRKSFQSDLNDPLKKLFPTSKKLSRNLEIPGEKQSRITDSKSPRAQVSREKFSEVKKITRADRTTKSPSPDPSTRKSEAGARFTARRSVPSSPSKSPDIVARRSSVDSKSQESKARRPLAKTTDCTSVTNKKAPAKSTDVVDGVFENGYTGNHVEGKYENDSATKKADAFVIDFNEQTKDGDAHSKKPPSRKQSIEKSTSAGRPTSSVSSISSASSTQGVASGAKGKMATRAKTPISSSLKGPSSAKGGSAIDNLVSCKVCGRRFAQDRISLHEQICSKTAQKKRKQFDAMIHRVKGTEFEPFVKKGIAKKQSESKPKKVEVKSNWRRKHEDFISAIRSAKQVQAHLAAGGKLSDLPPPPASDTSDYVQCPHCGRKFNQAAAERHIPKCEHMLHNKPAHARGASKPKR